MIFQFDISGGNQVIRICLAGYYHRTEWQRALSAHCQVRGRRTRREHVGRNSAARDAGGRYCTDYAAGVDVSRVDSVRCSRNQLAWRKRCEAADNVRADRNLKPALASVKNPGTKIQLSFEQTVRYVVADIGYRIPDLDRPLDYSTLKLAGASDAGSWLPQFHDGDDADALVPVNLGVDHFVLARASATIEDLHRW